MSHIRLGVLFAVSLSFCFIFQGSVLAFGVVSSSQNESQSNSSASTGDGSSSSFGVANQVNFHKPTSFGSSSSSKANAAKADVKASDSQKSSQFGNFSQVSRQNKVSREVSLGHSNFKFGRTSLERDGQTQDTVS